MTLQISKNSFRILDMEKEQPSLSILDENSLQFQLFKIIYDDNEIIIQTSSHSNQNNEINKFQFNEFIIKNKKSLCHMCKKEINTFNFNISSNIDQLKLCLECKQKIQEKEKYIPFEDYISKCIIHDKIYELFCINCNKNMCEKCKSDHKDLGHKYVSFDKIIPKKDEIDEKEYYCKKAKYLLQIFRTISEIKSIEFDLIKSMEINNFVKRLTNEIKFAEIIISTFQYFFERNKFCYGLISNFNEINFNKKIIEKMNISKILEDSQDLLGPSFHIIMESTDMKELNNKRIIPLSHRKKVVSEERLSDEIRGIIELSGGYYLAGSKSADIGIFDKKSLEFKGKIEVNDIGITLINHLTKIKDDKMDLCAIASNLSDIIIISIFETEKHEKKNFEFKIECQIKAHSGKINRIIQLSNDLIASSSIDGYVMLWEKIKKSDNSIFLQNNTKINLGFNIHYLIECKYTNELICNSVAVDLKNFTKTRNFDMWWPQDESFNCAICLFNKKYLAYVSGCDNVQIINIEKNVTCHSITPKYDYVDAVFTVDGETICLCTRDLYNIFQPKYSQQFRLIENNFKEIGHICHTGTCNYFMNDSDDNFVMGIMSGNLIKYIIE